MTRALLDRGDRVTAMDVRLSPELEALAVAHETLNALAGDLMEWPRLAEIFAIDPPDGIVHCAAIVGVVNSVHAPLTTMRVNVESAISLLEIMRLHGIRRMIHMSSEETYGNFESTTIDETHPQTPVLAYGISKLAVEHLARSYRALYGVETIHLRTSWVYGHGLPRNRVPRSFVDAAIAGMPLHVEAGANFCVDHTYIDDVVDGVLGALDLPHHPFDAYNIASGEAPPLDAIASMVCEMVPGARISVGPGDYAHGVFGGLKIPSVRKGALDVSRAKSAFGYLPQYDMRRGLAAYIAKETANTTGRPAG